MNSIFSKKMLKFFGISVLIVIIIMSYIIMNKQNSTFQSSETLQTKIMQATKIDSVSGWRNRVLSYANRTGRSGEQKWLFTDIQNQYKDLYCIQSGNSHSTDYDVYDLYTISDNNVWMNTYFNGDIQKYYNFMWIIENMYISDMENTADKEYMESQLLDELCKIDKDARTYYENMQNELLNMYKTATSTDGDAGTDENGNVIFPLWKINSNGYSYRSTDTVAIYARENFIRTIQNYVLLHHVKQRNGYFGLRPLNDKGEISLDLRTFKDDRSCESEIIGNETNAKKFANVLLKYLELNYESESYNINKYKNFFNRAEEENVILNKSEASYDNANYRVGPFKITNKYGFTVKIDEVKVGSNSNITYKIVDIDGNEIDLSAAETNNKDFYIQFENDIRAGESDETISLSYTFDYGAVPTANIFIPTGVGTNPQTVINVDRTHVTHSDTWSETIEGIHPDIALKKHIYQINGVDVDKRLISIDTSTIAGTHQATYNMKKTPITVNIGDTVTYAIQLFNEGNIDGTASKIIDYLPNGLNLVRVYGNGKDAIYSNLGNDRAVLIENPYDQMISKFEDEDGEEFEARSQTIYVECEVVKGFDGIYTNVSEITEYKLEKGSDIDSSSSNWKVSDSCDREYNNSKNRRPTNRLSDIWKNYSNNQDDHINDASYAFVGQEDDDDFDKIKVNTLDLALTKSISWKYDTSGEKVALTTDNAVHNKEMQVIGNVNNVMQGDSHDLTYNMNKQAAQVMVGDKVISRIRVYNEGKIDGVVKQISDYMPVGLRFLPDETIAENGGESSKYSFNYDESNNYLNIVVNGETGVTLASLKEEDGTIEPKFIEVLVVCEVTEDASGVLFNSAAITNYGYMKNGTTYVSAEQKNIDIDSYQVTNPSEVKYSHKNSWNKKNDAEKGAMNKSELQVEDDDDVDCIRVDYKPQFDLALRKNIYKIDNKVRNYRSIRNLF